MSFTFLVSTIAAQRGRILRSLPASFIVIRVLLGPLMFLSASGGEVSIGFLVGLIVGPLLDLFDGVIARRLNIVSPQLREADGRADVWFYGWVSASAWVTHPEIVFAYRVPLLTVIGFQCLAWVIEQIKYRRFSNYHAYTGRLWGVSLLIATLALFAFNEAGIFLWFAIVCGVLNVSEGIAMTLILPKWTHDVPSILHALRLRKSQRIELMNLKNAESEI